jgi:hypothetical protein
LYYNDTNNHTEPNGIVISIASQLM